MNRCNVGFKLCLRRRLWSWRRWRCCRWVSKGRICLNQIACSMKCGSRLCCNGLRMHGKSQNLVQAVPIVRHLVSLTILVRTVASHTAPRAPRRWRSPLPRPSPVRRAGARPECGCPLHSAETKRGCRLGQPRSTPTSFVLYQRVMPQTAARVVASESLFPKERGPDLSPAPQPLRSGPFSQVQSWPFGERGSGSHRNILACCKWDT
jgi:hypothetical protein